VRRYAAPVVYLVVATGAVVTGQPSAAPKLPPADVTLSAADFYTEFRKGAEAAAAKYKGKVVELSGKIYSVGYNDGVKSSVIIFEGPEKGRPIGAVCVVPGHHFVGELGRGQTITVRGTTVTSDARLESATLVKRGPDTVVRVAAPDLTKAYNTDRKAVEQKYLNKTLVVTGEVLEFKNAPGSNYEYLELKGSGATRVKCWYPLAPSLKQQVRVGQTVRFAGHLFPGGSDDDLIMLMDAKLTGEQPKAGAK
jgi:hypothetical protein